jgi:inorganic pyrophosphatase
MNTAMYYPCNYGYIPHTLSEDGDPADVLVVTPIPLISGLVIRCHPVGVLNMTDESGGDAAKQEINDSVKRFNQLKEKPNF